MIDSQSLLAELLETFRLEARDHLSALSSLLIELERESDPARRKRHVESVFRRMHTLKGAAHAVNLIDVARICQELESLLADLKRGDRELDLPLFDRLHGDIDALSGMILSGGGQAAPEAAGACAPLQGAPEQQSCGAAGANPPGERESQALPPAAPPSPADPAAAPGAPQDPPGDAGAQAAAGHNAGAAADEEASFPRPAGGKGAPDDTVRVSTRLLESLLLQAEELVSTKLAASALHEELAAAAAELAARGSARARAQDLAREAIRKGDPDPLVEKLASLVQQQSHAERLMENRLRSLEKVGGKHLWTLRGMVDPMLEEMKKLHLLPFSSLTSPLGKLVRDLSRELGKQAELNCAGDGIELDRRILAELKEPLLHMVRNMMDHGIESEAERERKGKPARGRLEIAIRLQDANHAEVVISDDGRGIDPALLKGAALRLELLSPEAAERMSDQEALQLVFESGISTSSIITTLSGRGLGLAIVREAVERLGGHVSVASVRERGTEFRLLLPLSFAMMRALLVETTGRRCMIPAANVELTSRVPIGEIRRVENRDTVLLNGEITSLVGLGRLLELEEGRGGNPEGFQPVVLLNQGEKRIAFAVDQVVGVQEVLVKPLGRQLSRVRNVSGATVLGDGGVVPVLNVGDLFRSALAWSAPALAAADASASRVRRLSVLVAEDSITSRTLLKNILESCGFIVATAMDGADALSQVKTGSFDLVISDVEMPRMDGFQLTAAIRGDKKSAELPVILVTGLESREDRERGIEVGADAYLVKSSFDQGSLMDLIQKLT